jgi:hypothetical protein
MVHILIETIEISYMIAIFYHKYNNLYIFTVNSHDVLKLFKDLIL